MISKNDMNVKRGRLKRVGVMISKNDMNVKRGRLKQIAEKQKALTMNVRALSLYKSNFIFG